jgi:hypothetical protein
MVSQTRRWEFQSMTSFRKFLSIASQCGDGLRPELQALFERLAVDPHSGLFVRNDGMVQSGPDPISAKAPLAQNAGETRTSNAGSSQHLVVRKKFQSAD